MTLQIELLNPKAEKLLKDLEDLKLIKIEPENAGLKAFLKKMRRKADTAPSLEEITEIVEEVRAARYAKKQAAKNNH